MTTLTTPARTPAPTMEAISFGGCDYLGLSKRPEVVEALRASALEWGVSSSASRTTAGNRPAHDSLERTIARFVRANEAILLPEGYLANLALCQALAGSHPIAVIDERAHASLHNAASAAGMRVHPYAHGDARSAAERMDGMHGMDGPVAVLTDGVFTADGELAPARELLDALRPGDVLVLDECHALGVLGESGRGSCEHFGLDDPRVIRTSTLAKGIGCYGGFVAGGSEIIGRIRSSSPAYICTTPIPPALAAASERAIEFVETEPGLVGRLRSNAERLGSGLERLGLACRRATPTPIAAFTLADDRMESLAAGFGEAGMFVPLIRYPGGPAARYFRVTVTASHSSGQIDRLIECIGAALRRAA